MADVVGLLVWVVGIGVCGVGDGRVDGVERRGHETEDEMESECAEYSDAVDVAVEHFSGEKKECSVEEDIEDRTVQVAVVHEVLVDVSKGIQDGQCLFHHVLLAFCYSRQRHCHRTKQQLSAYLRPDMLEIYPQLLQQRWLAVVPFRPERSKPSCP